MYWAQSLGTKGARVTDKPSPNPMMSKRDMISSLALLVGFSGGALLILFLGKVFFDLDVMSLMPWFEMARGTIWAFPLAVLIFTVLAFIGVPQWILITGCIIAFGPWTGALYAWGATLISACQNFWMARYLGASRLQKVGGDLINRIAGLVRKNGFFTSLTVRLVPTGPFILVNMAAGLSKMPFWGFFCGTALGIIPKIAAIALAGQSVVGTYRGQTFLTTLLPAVLALCAILLMIYGRKRLLKRIPKKQKVIEKKSS